jgi:hypothetical protein
MKETSIQELVAVAHQLHAEGKKWHFHMLTPDCQFNKNPNKQAFVLENTTDDETSVAYSDERYMKEGQELVKLAHGTDIIQPSEKNSPINNANIERMVERAKELNNNKIIWHHHMLFPDCILNKDAEKWCIVFEDPKTGEVIKYLADHEPLEELRAIEVLYYKQKK